MFAIAYHVSWLHAVLLLGAVSLLYMLQTRHSRRRPTIESESKDVHPRSELSVLLVQHLPESVFFRQHWQYTRSVNSYWSKQQRELLPECVVKPQNEQEVSAAIRIIKAEFDLCVADGKATLKFAVRSGGHSTVPGASSISDGIVIDLSLFNQIELVNKDAVLIGCGARWGQVSRELDAIGLAVAGGRNSDVGVGGLTLGGGYSYFSPQCGFVCDNVLEYRVVLASGELVIASASQNAQLWRALKGGSSNFGIVTSFTMRAFPCANVWAGFLYMFSWKAPELLRAFYRFNQGTFDERAGGPLLCMSYVQQIGMHLIAAHMMYTKPEPWPACWREFRSIGRIWSSTKIRSLTSTTDELDGISPAGFRYGDMLAGYKQIAARLTDPCIRQLHISTTVKNNLPTLEFAHMTYKKMSKLVRGVKGMVWTLVLQPLHSSTMSHGQDNVLGLYQRKPTENLVVVLFTAVWERGSDDLLVNKLGKQAIDEIDKHAATLGTADEFRYLNWCDSTQQPFPGYGRQNLKFLEDISKDVDPDRFFQQACLGGFKLSP